MSRVFLLGGMDLEMHTIRGILQERGCIYFDHGLSWENAYLSAYADRISTYQGDEIIGIELRADIEPPKNYTLIDHHNDRRHEKSSIEQVADLLGIELTRYQMLVAANDREYIGGLIKMEASPAEIESVRRLDRRCQGVTDEEEEQARRDIACKWQCGDLTVVETEVQHFSPIVDHLYPIAKLLVISQDELTYYGLDSGELAQHFSAYVDEHKAYYGGQGTSGYFGLAKGCFTAGELQAIKDELIKLMQ